jgi:hypothetical protein
MMAPFAVTGTLIAAAPLAAMARGPVGVKLAPYHLSYGTGARGSTTTPRPDPAR